MKKEDILRELRSLKKELKVKFKVRNIGLFGSRIRGTARPSSDIDILVEMDDGADLIDLIELELFLTQHLNHKVDVSPKNALRPELKSQILKEVAFI